MTVQITNKLEIEIGQLNQREILEAGTFSTKNHCQAIIVMPDAVAGVMMDKSTRNSQYRVIAAIDFPNGRNFALDKWRDISPDVLAADGFEILLSMGRTPADCRNEIRAIMEFIRGQVNPMAEIRFVIRAFERSEKELDECFEGFRKNPPNMIRLDHRLLRAREIVKAVDAEKCNRKILDDQIKMIEALRSRMAIPIKVSGNVDLAMVQELSKVHNTTRFGVSLAQAKSIMKEALEAQKVTAMATATAKKAEESKDVEDEEIASLLGEVKVPGKEAANGELALKQGPLGRDVRP
jgi:hypothetical protein